MQIPRGRMMAYGEIAKEISRKHRLQKISAQVVGGTVGWNPISLIIPCHRAAGTGGFLARVKRYTDITALTPEPPPAVHPKNGGGREKHKVVEKTMRAIEIHYSGIGCIGGDV